MNKLTYKELETMKILWKAKRGFIKELIEYCPDPKPLYNTFLFLIRGLERYSGIYGEILFTRYIEFMILLLIESEICYSKRPLHVLN